MRSVPLHRYRGTTTAVRLAITGALAITVSSLAGCVSPVALHRAVIEYDRAVSDIQGEMLLLNIARARHFQPLHFTAVSSVAATFDIQASIGLAPAQAGLTEQLVAPVLGASVAERPTITIVPVEGEDFTKRILSPTDAVRLIFLHQQGVEPALLLRMMADELVLTGERKARFFHNDPRRVDEYTEFRRRILHLSSLKPSHALHIGPIAYEEVLPIALPPVSRSGETLQALDKVIAAVEKGYQWESLQSGGPPTLVRQVVGRPMITNYDPNDLSNEERRRLNEEAEHLPPNKLLVDIRPDGPGGEYPMHGHFVLRSFNAIMRFLGNGIIHAPEFPVEKDPRTGPILQNPPGTIVIEETDARPSNAAFSVEYEGLWYSMRRAPTTAQPVLPWNQEAFRVLNQLYQMTVTESRAATPAITIAK